MKSSHLRACYGRLQKRLDGAYEKYLTANDDGKEGAELGCQAVAKFLHELDEHPERAAIFMALTKSFQDLRSVGRIRSATVPPIFSRQKRPTSRPRTSLHRHLQLMAVAMMEALMRIGEREKDAASIVARSVSKWRYIDAGKLTATTVQNWRKRRRSSVEERKIATIVGECLTSSHPRGRIDETLKSPPSIPGPQAA